jgi:hypothetical protein
LDAHERQAHRPSIPAPTKKINFVSMCLELSCSTGFLLRAIADWLSILSSGEGTPAPTKSCSSSWSHTTAMYSTSHDDSATTHCFYDYHAIGLPPRR